jgi:predicted flap endonuclease-1-like 5' DNA nuclease
MKNVSSEEIFNNWAATQQQFWEGLQTRLPAFRPPATLALWQEAYRDQLSAWEMAVRQTLKTEMDWVEQWAEHVTNERGMPPLISDWSRQVEQVVRSWIGTQVQLWDECFALLRNSTGSLAPFKLDSDVFEADQRDVAAKPEVKPAPPPAPRPAAASASPPTVADDPPVADDLKLISGIGPAIERKLNAAGITRFQQLAELDAATIGYLEREVLKSVGCFSRDNWIAQARALGRSGA